jgi:hypothetical protein
MFLFVMVAKTSLPDLPKHHEATIRSPAFA